MELSLEQYESILQYLDDKMTDEQEKVFMDEVSSNSLLQEYLQFELELRQNIHFSAGTNDISLINANDENVVESTGYIKSLAKKAEDEWIQESKTKDHSGLAASEKKPAKAIAVPLWLRIVAAACLILAVVGVVKYMSQKPEAPKVVGNNKVEQSDIVKDTSANNVAIIPKDSFADLQPPQPKTDFAALFEKFYKKDKAPEQKPLLLAEALIDYENDDYSRLKKLDLKNLPLIRGIPDDDLNSDQNVKELAHYYKGIALMQVREIRQASSHFQWLTDHANNRQLIVKAQWYLALCNLALNNVDQANTLLTSVSGKRIAPYNNQAKELLKVLKQ